MIRVRRLDTKYGESTEIAGIFRPVFVSGIFRTSLQVSRTTDVTSKDQQARALKRRYPCQYKGRTELVTYIVPRVLVACPEIHCSAVNLSDLPPKLPPSAALQWPAQNTSYANASQR